MTIWNPLKDGRTFTAPTWLQAIVVAVALCGLVWVGTIVVWAALAFSAE